MYESCESDDVEFSPLLFSFLTQFKFNKKNLNCVNHNGVTPLTLSIERNQNELVIELLQLKANPLMENIHGNTALSLLLHNSSSSCLATVKQAIENKTCATLDCITNKYFCYDNKTFIITKVLAKGGACSLAAFELQDCRNSQKHFAKIKTNFGGLEIRNYIFLDQYVDLFFIKELILYNNQQQVAVTIKDVCCLMQKIAPGEMLSVALTSLQGLDEKQIVITSAIKALCDLHRHGYIHNDALPNNCLWDQETQTATFIDYDVMRIFNDIVLKDPEHLEEVEYLDLKRLIFGDVSANVYGLRHHVENITRILEDFDSTILKPKIKNKLLRFMIS